MMSVAFSRFVLTVAALTLALPAAATTQSVTAARPPAAGRDSLGEPLRPGDVVRLRVWREPDLTGEFPVDETGSVVLPKLGPTQVTTEASALLKARIVAAYSRFLNHTAIDVTFLRRIQVLGAVRQPGVYPVDPTMTISDVLAVAGGMTGDGDPGRLELIRDGQRLQTTIAGHSLLSDTRVRSGDQIYVPERSWFRRNTGFLIGTMVSAVVTVLVTRGIR
jgi:protein involved in polysaccharide export with SLBB domain